MITKRLLLVEYDDNGNEIDRIPLAEHEDLLNILSYNERFVKSRYLLCKEDRSFFTDEQWKTIETYSNAISIYVSKEDNSGMYIFGPKFHSAALEEEWKEFWINFFKEPEEKQRFILTLTDSVNSPGYSYWQIQIGEHPALTYDSKSIKSVVNWVNNRTGIYYAVDNNNERTWDFIDKPTLKQAVYQRRKGRRIVFLNFKDWKEYLVSENELKQNKI